MTRAHGFAHRLAPWLLPAILLGAWFFAAKSGWISPQVFPAPWEIGDAAIRLGDSGELLEHLRISTARAGLGFVIGGGIGFLLGLLNGLSPLAERLLDGSVQMIRNIPHLALIPLVVLWFGIGEEAKVFLVTLGVFFPLYINTFHGVRTVDRHLLEMGRMYGLGDFDLFREVIFPGALPSILVGVRYAFGLMWLTLIVAETIASTSGIGYLAMSAREFMQTDVVLLAILLYSLLGKLADSLARWLERRLLNWHPAYR
ncbi:MAG: aliphatic sulfonate ABC transporter permease SsuC [Methylococcaceae bacterium]|nr:aliphatic sulfonate ABC transporter permease SsuC [Methylococcaceae bacterium]